MAVGPEVAEGRTIDVLRRQLAAAVAERDEAQAQQSAMAEVLRAINTSSGDLKPVFDMIIGKAMALCDAAFGGLLAYDNQHLTLMADRNSPAAMAAYWDTPQFVDPGGPIARVLASGKPNQIADLAQSEMYRKLRLPLTVASVELGGIRTVIQVPLLGERGPIGLFVLYRQQVKPFSEKQIALVEAFAAQATLAMENARLIAEQRDALEQQTATADILRVISQSPTDVAPVLTAVAKAALRFCGADDAVVTLRDGDHWLGAAHEGPMESVFGQRHPLVRETAPGRAMIDGQTVHLPDIQALDPVEFATARSMAAKMGFRASLAAPMLREGAALGAIVLRKPAPGPFTPRQIRLLEAFAAQAVIAIENVRLFTELRESLDQQTATAEILRAISRSPTEVQPVLDAVVKAAVRFCGATDAVVGLRLGDDFKFVAQEGPLRIVLGRREALNSGSATGRAILTGATSHLPNIPSLDRVEFASAHLLSTAFGFKSAAAAPMLREGVAIGAIALRKPDPSPFTPRQLDLLENFAAQAVIAIENVRLFTELRESLEQQTATAEILRVISESPTDVQPVMAAVVSAARRFCGATDAIITLRDGAEYVHTAHDGTLTAAVGVRRPLDRSTSIGRAIVDGTTVHLPDMTVLDPAEWGTARQLASTHNLGAAVAAPMLRDGVAVGGVLLRKTEVGAFTPRQIELLETFAAQAVIAIENVRLFTETKEALERQTATAEILQVIGSSPTDTQPVFDAIVNSGVRLFPGAMITVARPDGATVRAAAIAHEDTTMVAGWRERFATPLSRDRLHAAAILDAKLIDFPDAEAEKDGPLGPGVRNFLLSGNRAVTIMPMLRGEGAIGAISVTRAVPGPLSGKQIAILRTFADQAVIAIENVRLFSELREALEQQTATADILRVISQSPTDVQPVLAAVVAATRRFCGADDAIILLRDGADVVVAAHDGPIPAPDGERRLLTRGSVGDRAIIDGRTIDIPDFAAPEAAEYHASLARAQKFGFQASIAAPMLREGVGVGSIVLRKPEAGAFTPRQVELLETFAAQAVIAIENVRLFTELRDSLDRLKAAQANLVQSEKMATLGQLTAGIAHEIKNPLNFVNNFASLSVELLDELREVAGPALATLDADKRAELDETMSLLIGNLGKITEHGKRADGIVKSMLSHSRGGAGDWQPSDINALVEEALNLAYHGARAQDKEFNVSLERDFAREAKPIEVVPQDVTRVFLNLFGNGFYATRKRRLDAKEAGFRPTLRVTTRDLGDGVEVKVRDNGTGMPAEVREKLFQPFFTTKPTGEGTGLGLSISYDIVTQQHGGSIGVESEPGSFTEFTVRLPRSRRVVPAEKVR